MGRPIVFWRRQDGALCAIEDRCAHRNVPLSIGRCEGDDLRCLYHGLRFSASGRCVEVPGQRQVPASLQVRTYTVQEHGGLGWVWMGQPGGADPEAIPAVFPLADDGWVGATRAYDFAAPAELVAENLLDSTHYGYIHGGGFTEDWWIKDRPRVAPCEGGLEIEWRATDLQLPDGSAIDQHAEIRFLFPGIMVMALDNYPPGTGQRLGEVGGAAPPLDRNRAVFAPVPVTGDSSCLMVSWSIPDEEGARTRLEALMAGLDHGFDQDRRIVEAQHRNRQLFGSPPSLAVRADEAILLFQRLCARMAAKADKAGPTDNHSSVGPRAAPAKG